MMHLGPKRDGSRARRTKRRSLILGVALAMLVAAVPATALPASAQAATPAPPEADVESFAGVSDGSDIPVIGSAALVTWDAPSDADPDGYAIYRVEVTTDDTAEPTGQPVAQVQSNRTFHFDPAPGTGQWFYQVAATYGSDESDRTDAGTIRLTRNATPTAPATLEDQIDVESGANPSITLKWGKPDLPGQSLADPSVMSYRIYRNATGEQAPTECIATVTASNEGEYKDTDVKTGFEYTYAVTGTRDINDYTAAASEQASTDNPTEGSAVDASCTGIHYQEGPPVTITRAISGLPGAPGTPTVHDVTTSQLILCWPAPANGGGIETYHIDRKVDGGTWMDDHKLVSTPTPSPSACGGLPGVADTGLSPDTDYSYRVSAENGVGEGPESPTVTATTESSGSPPAAPTGLVASTGSQQGEIDLAWDPVTDTGSADLDDYKVQRAPEDGGTYTTVAQVPAGTTTHTDTGLADAEDYWYRVVAVNTDGLESSPSTADSATTLSPEGPPGPPTSLSADQTAGQLEVVVSWSQPADNGGESVDVYAVERSIEDGAWQDRTLVFESPYEDSEVACDTEYAYRVQARNDHGWGDWATSSPVTISNVCPDQPEPVEASRGPGANTLTVDWGTQENADGYEVYRRAPGETTWGDPIATFTAGTTSHEDTGIPSGAERCYAVKATSRHGDSTLATGSAGSNCASTHPVPQPPTDVVAEAVRGETSIEVTWSAPSDDGGLDIDAYLVERSPDGSAPWSQIAEVPGDQRAITDTDPGQDEEFYYRVKARTDAGTSDASLADPAISSGPPSSPEDLVARPTDVGRLTLTWDAPSDDGGADITAYHIERLNTSSTETTTWTVDNTTRGVHDDGLADGTRYCYQITTENRFGTSAPSRSECMTTWGPPDAPRNVDADTVDVGEIVVDWNTPEDDNGAEIDGYTVYRFNNATKETTTFSLAAGTTSMRDTGLDDGVTYCYEVTASNELGEGNRSAQSCSFTPGPPDAPQNLDATAGPDRGEINLTWEVPQDDNFDPVDGYTVYRTNTSSGETTTFSVAADKTTFQDSGLADITEYCYQVTASNGFGEGNRSNEACAETFGEPGAPKTMDANAGPDQGEISVTWTKPDEVDGGIDHYTVYRQNATSESDTDESAWTQVATTPAGTTSFVDSSLGDNTPRCYLVNASTQIGEGPSSDIGCARTFHLPSQPDAPSVAADAGDQLTVDWLESDATNGIEHYNVYRRLTTESTYEKVDTVQPPTTMIVDTGLADDTGYCYRVSAVNPVGESARSVDGCGETWQTPNPPKNPSAVSEADSEIRFSWDAPDPNPDDDADRYIVYRDGPASDIEVVATVPVSTESLLDTGLADDAEYCYQVSAVNDAGEGAPSSLDCATTPAPPSPPQQVEATAGPGVGEVTLDWCAPANEGGSPVTAYTVYRQEDGTSTWEPVDLVEHDDTGDCEQTYLDAARSDGTTYRYEVTARNDVGDSDRSSTATATTFGTPSKPTNVQATPGPDLGKANVSWEEPMDNGSMDITAYHVDRRVAGTTSWTAVDTVGPNARWLVDDSVSANTTYEYRVTAENPVGQGPASALAQAETWGAPTGLNAPTAGPGSGHYEIDVDWTAPDHWNAPAGDEYRVLRSVNGNSFTLVNTITVGDGTQWTDTSVSCDNAYAYKITAVNDQGASTMSAASTAVPVDFCPSPPANLVAEGGIEEVTVEWQEPVKGDAADGFEIRYKEASAASFPEANTLHNNTGDRERTIEGPAANTTYEFQMRSLHPAGGADSGWTATVRATTAAGPGLVQNLEAIPLQNATLLVWNPPNDNNTADQGPNRADVDADDSYGITEYRIHHDGEQIATTSAEEPTVQRVNAQGTIVNKTYTFIVDDVDHATGVEETFGVSAVTKVAEGPAATVSQVGVDVGGAAPANGAGQDGVYTFGSYPHTLVVNQPGDDRVYVEAAPSEGGICFGSTNPDGSDEAWTLYLSIEALGLDHPGSNAKDADLGTFGDGCSIQSPGPAGA